MARETLTGISAGGHRDWSCDMRGVFLAFAQVNVLDHTAEDRVYGVGMIKEFPRHGCKIKLGTLYPLPHRIHAQGLLSFETEIVEGKVRKYYTITRNGRAVLDDIRPQLTELAEEVLPILSATPPTGAKRPSGTGRE
jgi:DNA-binding PadR family transcriptional regulator